MKDVIIVFVILLVLLTLISTFGGSVRPKERFYEVPSVPSTMPSTANKVPSPDELAAMLKKISEQNPAAPALNAQPAMRQAPSMPSAPTMPAPVLPPVSMESAIEKFENNIEAFDSIQSFAAF